MFAQTGESAGSMKRRGIAGFLLICAMALLLTLSGALRWADGLMLDAQMRWLAGHFPVHLPEDVVVIGIDEADFESIAEPYALWHQHLGRLLSALGDARPAVVGLAIALPVRSYEFIVKGIDQPLIQGFADLRAHVPLVIGDRDGIGHTLRPIAPDLLAQAGPRALASLTLCEDADGVVRRVGQVSCAHGTDVPGFAQSMAHAMGNQEQAGGIINFYAGGAIRYVSLQSVLGRIAQGQTASLEALVKGRAVIVASVLPTDTHYRVPLPLAAWNPASRDVPADLVQVQVLRSLLGPGLIQPASKPLVLGLSLLCALMWFGRNGRLKALVLAMSVLALLAGATLLLWRGQQLPTATLLLVALLAFGARLLWESVGYHREKQLLRNAFAGHVSPLVMRAIVRGHVWPDGAGNRVHAAILFADIRDFAARSVNSPPESTIALLNSYFAEVATAIYAHGGAIHRLTGEGLMATFGVPLPTDTPQRNALEAAQDLLRGVQRLNAQLRAQGQATIVVGIGIHCGDVLAGYVGSRQHREFVAIGATVNAAAALQAMTRSLNYPVLCSHAVAESVGFTAGMVDLGDQMPPGGDAMRLWGWNPGILKHLQ